MKVAAITGGVHVPSARFRVRSLEAALMQEGIDLTEYPAVLGAYPPARRWIRPLWAAASLASRVPALLASQRSDVTLLQREMLSTYATLERFTGAPRVLDVDDAIWLYRGGEFARTIAEISAAVICGNPYIAEWFSQWNGRTPVIPTAVDTNVFAPSPPVSPTGVIGWSGTSGGFKYLYGIEEALREVLRARPHARLRVVSDHAPRFTSLPAAQVDFVQWTPAAQVHVLQDMQIGIMPIDDSAWSRGKCSFKMLTYMACGVPVVVSSFGMNTEVLARGEVGLGVQGLAEWSEALIALLDAPARAADMGRTARRVVETTYSIDVIAPQVAGVLKQAAGLHE